VNKRYRQTRFLLSTPDNRHAPADEGVEVAFAGRSNAGKSSALNAITSQHSLARTSKTPGRTRQINFFAIDDRTRLVDLPGYGYARVSRNLKNDWQRNLSYYLESRQSLQGLILLMDIRHPLKEFDRQLLTWCHRARLACHVLLTKSDKLKRGPARTALLQVRKQLPDYHPEATVQLFSARTPAGIDGVHTVLDRWLMLKED
jgi:GTP-binding protein